MNMYNEVRNLFNTLHDTVFKNYEIESINVNTEHIIVRSIVNGFFIRVDFGADRIDQYKDTIQFSSIQYKSTDEVPLDEFNKRHYFDAVMLDTTLSYEDARNIARNASMFAKCTGRKMRVYISREQQTKRK